MIPPVRYTLRQLRYFVATANTGSIAAAARQIHISQPSISAAIASLEASFGIQLFLRNHASGLSLTPEGEAFLQKACSFLQQAHDLEAAMSGLSGKVTGEVHIGCMSTLYPFVGPLLHRVFQTRYPQAHLRIMTGHHRDLTEKLRRGDICAMICYDLQLDPDVDFHPCAALPPFVLVGETHPLRLRETVALREVMDQKFILLNLPVSRDYFVSIFARSHIELHNFECVDCMDTVRSLVAHGHGFSLLNVRPRNRASLDGSPLYYLRLSDDVPVLRYGLASIDNGWNNPRLTLLREICDTYLVGNEMPGTEP